MSLSNDQKEAVKKFISWWNGEYNKNSKIFTLSGPAGSGKSFLIRELVKEIKLDKSEVAVASYTGKASLVLKKLDFEAYTIHKLIYNAEIIDKNHVFFVLKNKLDHDYELIVIDEISMVSKKILSDLLTFDIKILAVGDKEQLPPIKEDNNSLLEKSDYNLTTIHRQALENPIIKFANEIRENKISYPKRREYRKDGFSAVIVEKRENIDDELFKTLFNETSQLLCGKNATKNYLNRYFRREILGIDTDKYLLPLKGEKIIIRKNNWRFLLSNLELFSKLNLNKVNTEKYSYLDKTLKILKKDNLDIKDLKYYDNLALINGMIGYSLNDVNKSINKDNNFYLDFRPDFCLPVEYFVDIDLDIAYFLEKSGINLDRFISLYNIKDNKDLEGKNYFDFSYAITTHLAQGSQFDHIVVMNEVFMKDHYKWLYTAVTRAIKSVIVIT